MANAETPPVLIAEGIGHLTRYFLREVGGMFWFIVNTIGETFDRIRRGRAPVSSREFLPLHRAGRRRFGSAGRDGFIFPRPHDGAADRLPIATFRHGATGSRVWLRSLLPASSGRLLTGIMLAARIGAAFTAELGTMQVSEEVEAIEAMGIGPLRFLVAPRMLALVLC